MVVEGMQQLADSRKNVLARVQPLAAIEDLSQREYRLTGRSPRDRHSDGAVFLL